MKTVIFYWPINGNVESCAHRIFRKLDNSNTEIYSIDAIDKVVPDDIGLIIVGGSTVGAAVWNKASDTNLWFDFFAWLSVRDLKNASYAIFGLGDQVLYPDHFVDGMMIIKKEFERTGARHIGKWPVEGYQFTGSDALEGNMFIGLALDEDQQDDLTDIRIEKWVEQIKKEAGF